MGPLASVVCVCVQKLVAPPSPPFPDAVKLCTAPVCRYCPQFEALPGAMTGREVAAMYARWGGVMQPLRVLCVCVYAVCRFTMVRVRPLQLRKHVLHV